MLEHWNTRIVEHKHIEMDINIMIIVYLEFYERNMYKIG